MKIQFFPHLATSIEELRKKQILDMVKLLHYLEDLSKFGFGSSGFLFLDFCSSFRYNYVDY